MTDLADALTDEPFDLDGYLELLQHESDAKPPWAGIDGPRTAQWCMSKYADAEAVVDAEEALATDWHERIDAAMLRNTRDARRTMEFMAGEMAKHGIEERLADPRKKSITLPSGVIKTREHKAKIYVDNEAELLAWLAENVTEDVRAAILNPPKVSLSSLREFVAPIEGEFGWVPMDPDGQMPAGVAVEPPGLTVSISTASPSVRF